jgi:hypothetical protein
MSCFDEIRLGIDARSSQSIRGRCWRLMFRRDDQGAARRAAASPGSGAEDVGKRV